MPNNTVFQPYEEYLHFIRKNKFLVCPKMGKSFGEIVDNFVVGGDETNLTADADGGLIIVGATEDKNH